MILSLLTAPSLSASPNRIKNLQTQVIAAVIVTEAGGEGQAGMRAVASVINNRAQASGQSPYFLVTRPGQFDGIRAIVKNEIRAEDFVIKCASHPRWAYSMLLAEKVNAGTMPDTVYGSTHFHNLSLTPYWAKIFPFKVQIGRHRFYREIL